MLLRHSILIFAIGCSLTAQNAAAINQALLAFPGAEGSGCETTGGRGREVRYVTNLNDDGPGSLREAVRDGNCTIVFGVSGTIDLQSRLVIRATNLTIAGQTAPGSGICLRGRELVIGGSNIIVRFLRLRPGDIRREECDALTVWDANRVIIDHCSLSWSTDSLNDVVRDSTNVIVQWCILAEPLNESVHHKGAHGYGTGWGSGPGAGNSFHHNLLAHCNSRAPRIGSEKNALVDVRNNVIYNTGGGWAYGGEQARVNFVGNFFKPGPDTKHPDQIFRLSSPQTRMYVRDNVVDAQPSVSRDNTVGIAADKGVDASAALVAEPFAIPSVRLQQAQRAYELVLEHAGAVLPSRDAVDERIVAEVRAGTGRIIDSQSDVGGWPDLASTPPPNDSDGDGMPDQWERKQGLDAANADDGPQTASDGYTNLEHYLNELAESALPAAATTNP
jgi:pectate lyase